jgi:hypothetical protein
MSALEQEIFEKVKRLDEQQKAKVLEFIAHIAPAVPSVVERPYTARELMQLPYEERNRIIMAQLESSQTEDFEIFNADGDEDWEDTAAAITPERPYTARELMQLPYEERNRAVKAALRRAQDMDVEYFDVYDDADFDDNNM